MASDSLWRVEHLPKHLLEYFEPVGGGDGMRARNPHPTVKPIALAKWLCKLLLPPPEYAPRRVLIPFSGTSSEGIGAMLAGWEEIVMIENESEYIGIAEARLRHWATQPEQMKLK